MSCKKLLFALRFLAPSTQHRKKGQKTAVIFSGNGARKIYNCRHVWQCVIIIFILLALKVGNAPQNNQEIFWWMCFPYEERNSEEMALQFGKYRL